MLKIALGSAAAAVAGILLLANVASAQQGPPSGRPGNVPPHVNLPPHVSVPEIDALSGLAAFAAVCAALALAWERRQKV